MSMIVANPRIQAGVPLIAGTRIPTRGIWRFRCAGYSIVEISQEYPSLSHQRIWVAIGFERRRRQAQTMRLRPRAHSHMREVDR